MERFGPMFSNLCSLSRFLWLPGVPLGPKKRTANKTARRVQKPLCFKSWQVVRKKTQNLEEKRCASLGHAQKCRHRPGLAPETALFLQHREKGPQLLKGLAHGSQGLGEAVVCITPKPLSEDQGAWLRLRVRAKSPKRIPSPSPGDGFVGEWNHFVTTRRNNKGKVTC